MLGDASISEGERGRIQSNREEGDKSLQKIIEKEASGSDYHIYRTGIYPHPLCKNVTEK